ncbi:methanogenesis marker protein 17 [Methanosalsum zhilinae DSM 4017]|uniref:Methanogenesis marker protein 17 n=1 Tax=Methanosalsum zhilinae (strain DSM 4017 / NBRC 107636 / OCM 62 / WeN5) TaxID=679901 RepID=F7XKF2_METZD|nr:methanogenesis marker 17 protein [Methanosalsum zhilinae]AEH61720.1 methanogenesis marker protein 17 [Methanosalsum zhilinae DSM 4017]
MDVLEEFIVESAIDSEASSYRMILEDIISDLNLVNAIGRIYVSIRPQDSVFQMAIVLRKSFSPVKVSDFSTLDTTNSGEKGVLIKLDTEKYLPQLLGNLWEKYQRPNVLQPERRTLKILCDDPESEIDVIADMVVDDPQKTLQSKLAEMAIRAAPEGFRVRYHYFEDNQFIFVASEEVMQDKWIEQAHEMLVKISGGDSNVKGT